ncbi:rRNA methyltransferase 3B, mitochondrial [Xyrauchen texanus]|uniref:rRNA methyltransferase 3B, mitochondrial n=1 Tax=Xyrauchen texanus TaxID=154827 RepID=UPI00224216DF|nr:rRNA methyltransferase 3B, mitochondrial [Xyrauchen texanus]
MATRIVSMRYLCPILALRCNVINVKRFVRRRRPLDPSKQNNSQPNENSSKENICRNSVMASVQRPDTVIQTHCNNTELVQFSGSALSGKVVDADHHISPRSSSSSRLGEVEGLLYERAQPGDKSLAKLVNIARSKKLREQKGKVVLEGGHFIRSALDAGAVVQTVFFSSVDALLELNMDKLRRANLVKVKMEDSKFWSDFDTSQGLIAIFKRPEASHLTYPEEKYGKPLPLTLICDNVRDPGNLGTVLRSAAAAGCHSVLLTKGCVDVWEPKVLRAAMGAHFRLPIIPSLTWSDIPSHLPGAATIHVADNCSTTINEDDHIVTPQKHKKACDFGWVRGHQYPSNVQYENVDLSDFEDYEDSRSKQTSKSLKTQYYYIDWVARHTGLVIGGETHGLSQEALQLAERTGGQSLMIPMVHGVDSLNSAMAASILLFEGRRQLLSVTEQIRRNWTGTTAP